MAAYNSERKMLIEAGVIAPKQKKAKRVETMLEVAMQTLSQIANTPRNAGARRNASATLTFIQVMLDDKKQDAVANALLAKHKIGGA